ncbi:hypothetical protein M569_02427, partial [Genlisea aurea]
QVANYCSNRIHLALEEELVGIMKTSHTCCSTQAAAHWDEVFTRCFSAVDHEIGGKFDEPIAAATVGSTAVVAVVSSSHIVVANCGDSRAVLYRGKVAVPLSVDHKPNREDECARIEAAGGKVIQWNGHRVSGILAMSRSIGDRYLKPWIIAEPEVRLLARAREDDFLILASDGLWDVVSNEEVCRAARKRILLWHHKNGSGGGSKKPSSDDDDDDDGVDPAAQEAAEYLYDLALHRGSEDNISVIVVDLKSHRKI